MVPVEFVVFKPRFVLARASAPTRARASFARSAFMRVYMVALSSVGVRAPTVPEEFVPTPAEPIVLPSVPIVASVPMVVFVPAVVPVLPMVDVLERAERPVSTPTSAPMRVSTPAEALGDPDLAPKNRSKF